MTKQQVINWIGKKNWKAFIKFYGVKFTQDYELSRVIKFIWK